MTEVIDTDAIRARAEAATPGPWSWQSDRWHGRDVLRVGALEVNADVAAVYSDGEPNAEFIAHARTDIPDLLAEVERQRKMRKAQLRHMAGEVLLRQSVSEVGWDRAEKAEATVARVEAERNRCANSRNYTVQFAGGLLREALRPPGGWDE